MNLPDELVLAVYEFLSLEDATNVRTLNHAHLTTVTSTPWDNMKGICNIEKWLKCFPNARSMTFHPMSIVDMKNYEWPPLEKLSLMNCFVGVVPQNLTYLNVNWCLHVQAQTLSALTNLTHLDVTGCFYFDGEALLGLTKLQSLFAEGCRQLDDRHFTTLVHLTNLDVSGCHLGNVFKNKKLKTLTISNSVINGDIFNDMPYLKNLYASHAFVSPVFLSSTLTVVNLDYIKWDALDVPPLPALRKASLRGTDFKTLRSFKTASWLDLSMANLDGLRDVRGSLMYLDISRGKYSNPHFLANLDSVEVFISFGRFEDSVFVFCPLVKIWSAGCQTLNAVDEEAVREVMKPEWVESCHEDMCYCSFL